MGADIADQIAQLRGFSRQQLLEMWQKLYRRAAPLGIRREIMVPFLAYKIQEDAYGGLKPATRAELRRIARGLEEIHSVSQAENSAQNQTWDPPSPQLARRDA